MPTPRLDSSARTQFIVRSPSFHKNTSLLYKNALTPENSPSILILLNNQHM